MRPEPAALPPEAKPSDSRFSNRFAEALYLHINRTKGLTQEAVGKACRPGYQQSQLSRYFFRKVGQQGHVEIETALRQWALQAGAQLPGFCDEELRQPPFPWGGQSCTTQSRADEPEPASVGAAADKRFSNRFAEQLHSYISQSPDISQVSVGTQPTAPALPAPSPRAAPDLLIGSAQARQLRGAPSGSRPCRATSTASARSQSTPGWRPSSGRGCSRWASSSAASPRRSCDRYRTRRRTFLLKLCLMSWFAHDRRRFRGALGGQMPRLLPGTTSPPGPGRR